MLNDWSHDLASPKTDSQGRRQIHIWLSASEAEALRALAYQHGQTLSGILRCLVRRHIRARAMDRDGTGRLETNGPREG